VVVGIKRRGAARAAGELGRELGLIGSSGHDTPAEEGTKAGVSWSRSRCLVRGGDGLGAGLVEPRRFVGVMVGGLD